MDGQRIVPRCIYFRIQLDRFLVNDMTEAVIIAILGSGAFSALVSGIVSMISERRKEKKGDSKCIMMLMADAIYTKGERLSKEDKVESEELKLFVDMYDLYKKKGGNGYADDLKNKVTSKPLM